PQPLHYEAKSAEHQASIFICSSFIHQWFPNRDWTHLHIAESHFFLSQYLCQEDNRGGLWME
ncbi:MAG: hypothetical protein IKX46_02915, partial [Verrucomicrobia bacterium]|nr:hypothetical protein [Verrucomicrobiota bacterium]